MSWPLAHLDAILRPDPEYAGDFMRAGRVAANKSGLNRDEQQSYYQHDEQRAFWVETIGSRPTSQDVPDRAPGSPEGSALPVFDGVLCSTTFDGIGSFTLKIA